MTTAFEYSFKSRLRNIAREKRLDSAQLWQNLVHERFLVRLSQSKYAPHFILKGGVLLAHYVDLNRHTQDLDFLVHKISNKIEDLEIVLTDVINMPVNDGFSFVDLKVSGLLHPHMKYPGVRATMCSLFGKTRFKVNVDLGFGDVIVPMSVTIPLISGSKGALLESKIVMTCYPQEFILAEKLETIVYRGANNSRMKDFHDLFVMIRSGVLEGEHIEKVIDSVFEHRKTEIQLPIVFSDQELAGLQQYWAAHVRGLFRMHSIPTELNLVISEINAWLKKHTRLMVRQ